MTPAQIAIAHQLRGSSWSVADLAACFHVTEAEFLAQCPFWAEQPASVFEQRLSLVEKRVEKLWRDMQDSRFYAAGNDGPTLVEKS